VTDATVYRRFGMAFEGSRPTVRLGDPGIDDAWLWRRRLGVAVATVWYLAFPIVCAIGFISAWGPFGLVDTWQLETFGSNSVILLTILAMPLAFLPLAVARPRRIDGSTPFLLGMRQAFDAAWGPRVDRGEAARQAGLRTARRVTQAMTAVGAVGLVLFAWKGFHDAAAPHAPLPEIGCDRLVDPAFVPPRALRIVGAVADGSRRWARDYSVRQDVHHDVYVALRPVHGPAHARIALVELDRTSPQYDAHARWNMVDAPGAREGTTAVLDDWTADRLRAAGFRLAPHVVLLERRQLHGRNPDPDPIEDVALAIIPASVLLVGLVAWWKSARLE